MNHYGYPSGIYSAPEKVEGGSCEDSVDLLHSGEEVIYNVYDSLAERFPYYVKKQVVGEVFGKTINRYTFANPPLENNSGFMPKPFKVCVISSIHGYEQGSAWTAAQFFNLLCNNTDDPHLSYLRRNVVFDVIPVANPWGFAHNDRRNGNGVDLNRNFSPHFRALDDITSEEYGGKFPESETETQVLMRFIEENSDADLVLDYHNIASGYPLFYVYGERDVAVADRVFSGLSQKWQNEYPELPKDRLLGRVKPNGGFGMFADYLLEKKLWVLTMEAPWCMPVIGKLKYDAKTIRCSLDFLVNTLLAVVSE